MGGCYCSGLSILRCLSIAVANKHVLVMFCDAGLLVVVFNNVVVFLMFFRCCFDWFVRLVLLLICCVLRVLLIGFVFGVCDVFVWAVSSGLVWFDLLGVVCR